MVLEDALLLAFFLLRIRSWRRGGGCFRSFLASGRGDLSFVDGTSDGRDREVAVVDHRANAVWQFHRRDVDRRTDLEAFEINLDVIRDLINLAVELDGVPDDVARLVRFLASDEAGWITGQIFGIDGGMGSIKMM